MSGSLAVAVATAASLGLSVPPALPTAPQLELAPVAAAPDQPGSITAPGLAGATLDTGTDPVDRMTVGVFVNGQGPFQFVVDTGATRTVLSSALAERLMLPPGKRAQLHDIGGVGGVSTALVGSLRVGQRQVADLTAPVLSAENMGADGILGIDGLADQIVDIDIPGAKMTINAPRRTDRGSDGTIVVKAKRRFGQLILADARIGGERVYVIVDSGAQYSVGNSALRARLSRGRHPLNAKQITLVGVSGRTMTADFAVTPVMRIGSMTVKNVPIAFSDVHPFRQFGLMDAPALFLGMDLIRSFDRVSLDFEQKKVRFRLRDE